MKKIYLLALTAITSVAFAQKPQGLSTPDVINVATPITKNVAQPTPLRTATTVAPKTLQMGKKSKAQLIGTTQNDQQTNCAIYNRMHVFPDGKISVTWTTSADAAPYATRGAGYNNFNGATWGPVTQQRIESERCGFPCYAYAASTNEEIITSHIVKQTTGLAGGLLMSRKVGVGAGTWTSTTVLDTTSTIPGILWNQTAVAGDYLIVFASYTDSSSGQPTRVIMDGVRTPQVYSRFNLKTGQWLVKNKLLPGYDASRVYSGGGDQYSIDARGNTVAILIGGLTDDLSLWKSTDAGATWTKTIIDSFPNGPFNYKKLVDTTYSNDGAVNVSIDANGNAHCFWAKGRVMDTNIDDQSFSYFPGQNAILYWNETMNIDSIQEIGGMFDEDANGKLDFGTAWNDNSTKYGNNSIATMPSSAIGADGTIYCIYSALTDNDISTDGKNFRDIYIVFSRNGGKTWSNILNLTSWLELNVEQVFGSLARQVDGKVHMTFLQKTSIGRFDATNNPTATGPYDIYYMGVDTADIFAGSTTGLSSAKNDLYSVSQNFPNPFTNETVIPVNFTRSSDVTVKIVDLMGREVYSNVFEKVSAGSSQLNIEMNNIPAGIYVYTIEADGFKVSRRMMAN